MGNDVKQVVVDVYTKDMLIKLQNYLINHQPNWAAISAKYSNQQLNLQGFQALLKDLDPYITSHEAAMIFAFADTAKTGAIPYAVIEERLRRIDYRSSDDVLSRKIDEIVAILKTQKADPVKIFEQIDLNHSGSLDFSEFSKFLTTIAPRYTKEEILQIFRLFDCDKNGLISKQ